MRAVIVERTGGPEVLTLGEREVSQPGPGEVLVQVAAIGVNFRDIYERQGIGGYRMEPPFVPGAEGAGRVIAVGPDVPFVVGDMVAWADASGSYAEQIVVPAVRVVRVPSGVSAEVAAAVMLQGMTAHYLCVTTYPVRSGEVTVVHAAAGGVGLLLTQMIKRRGGIVVATTSDTVAKGELARGAGADYVTDYAGFRAVVAEVTGGAGAHVVYDGVGKDTFDDSLAALRRRGMMVLYGGASGQVPPLDPQRLNSGGSLYLTRPKLGDYLADRDELAWRTGDLFEWIAAGELDVRIGGTYSLADAARAQEDLAARRTVGKLLLVP
jgi:NADPH:quinone reductase